MRVVGTRLRTSGGIGYGWLVTGETGVRCYCGASGFWDGTAYICSNRSCEEFVLCFPEDDDMEDWR